MLVRYRLIAGLSLTVSMLAFPAIAEVAVSGGPSAIEVIATQSNVREVLKQLSASYALDLHGTEDLSEPLTGTFKGDLRSVIEQVLGQHNHMVRQDGQRLAVFVTGSPAVSSPTKVAAPATAEGEPAIDTKDRPQPTLSPEGQRLAVKMFGEKGRYLQVDETLLRSFATGRGGRRFVQPAP